MPQNKKKTYWLSTLSASCILAIVGILIVVLIIFLFKVDLDDSFGDLVGLSMLILLVASPLLAILALLNIYRSGNGLGGRGLAVSVIIISSFFLIAMVPSATFIVAESGKMICKSNMTCLYSGINLYAEDNNDKVPESSKWCDLLIIETDVSPKKFICRSSDAKFGESSYTLNKNVISMKFSEIPKDMVLLFEAEYDSNKSPRDFPLKSRSFFSHLDDSEIQRHQSDKVYELRWNQVGGPELLAVNNHEPQGCNILFADGNVEFVELKKLPELKWKVDGKEDFPVYLLEVGKSNNIIKIISISVLALAIFVCTLFIFYKYRLKRYWHFIILLGLISAGVGCFFGSLAELLYRQNDIHGIGAIIGSITGLFTGLCYAVILANTNSELKQQMSFMGYAVPLGMAFGVICSTITHLGLMIIREETKPFGMISGLPFGIITGAILGVISFKIVKKYYTENVELSVPNEELKPFNQDSN